MPIPLSARLLALPALLAVVPIVTPLNAQLPTVTLQRGMVITSSVRIAPKVYRIPGNPSIDSAVVVVRGDDVVVDFAGATLLGISPTSDPDLATGVAIRVDGGRNVTIRNARVHGYKVGILARGTHRLSLVDNDLSYNWKPRLYSLIEHESLADWLSHHHNEKDEWLRFGAAVYLADVKGGEIRGNRAVQGMEALMLVRSDSLRIWNNVFSFNSGVGIGLYRSSDNVIMHNRVDFDVRGYSDRFYWRGQDSADLLVYEQSCRNIVAYNSMTHGGDGLFLWAGQQTMDTGEGGSNDNLFYENDFSFAPANSIEATFSRNIFARNRAVGSDYGVWGGYSYESRILDNDFARNRTGIAIEHGQKNEIVGNSFDHHVTAVQLWANRSEPSDWAYPKHHDTRSIDYRIADNRMTSQRVALRVSDTRESEISNNRITAADTAFVMKDTALLALHGNDTSATAQRAPLDWPRRDRDSSSRLAPAPIPGAWSALGDSLARRDRSAMIITEWGPYDWQSPLLWPVDSSRRTPLPLRVMGPAGTWRVIGRRGIASVSKVRGVVGDTVVVTPSGGVDDWRLTLEYRGRGPIKSPRGDSVAAGRSYQFWYERLTPNTSWDVAFYAWSDSTDPRTKSDALREITAQPPIARQQTSRLDYMWYSPTVKDVPRSKYAIVATTSVTLTPGTYTVRTISDDAVRLWIDGRLAIDDWTPHESIVDTAPIRGGKHELRVE
ncbi:MAG TPA: NosD domain-containing protein, partial [Gemmatimonadaceae bacterium]|nr:NosD domain-containing protein [Gemmatimonadaceae bacterium]